MLFTILLRRQRTKTVGDGLQWETKKIRLLKVSVRKLKKNKFRAETNNFEPCVAGSVERLVDHLACACMFKDDNFLSIFLATYRTFILPYQVLDMLFMRHEHLDLKKMQKSFEHRTINDEDAVKVMLRKKYFFW